MIHWAGHKKYFKKVLDKMNALRYYIKADSHSGLTKSLQSFYRPLMIERQCSLKTKQCNRNHAHMISSQMLEQYPRNEPVGRSWLVNVQTNIFIGEFDPGSGRTLAACLTHASRTGRSDSLLLWSLVANGWVTRRQPALQMGTTPRKGC